MPHAPAATGAAGKEEVEDDESSAAETCAAACCAVFESLRIEVLTMRGKVRYEWI